MVYGAGEYVQVETFRERALRLFREKAAREGKVKFSIKDIETDPLCPHIHLIKGSFKTVYDYIRAGGFYPATPNEDDLIRSLREFAKKYGRSPKTTDAAAGRLPYSKHMYEKRFVSWNAALKAAGLETRKVTGGRKKETVSPEEIEALVAELRELYGESGLLPTVAKHDAGNPPHSSSYLIKKLGDGKWRQVAVAADLLLASTILGHAA